MRKKLAQPNTGLPHGAIFQSTSLCSTISTASSKDSAGIVAFAYSLTIVIPLDHCLSLRGLCGTCQILLHLRAGCTDDRIVLDVLNVSLHGLTLCLIERPQQHQQVLLLTPLRRILVRGVP